MPPIFDNTGSTFDRGDFTDGNAFLWSSLDLSPYEGTDIGSTPYYIELLDGAGKKATGYIGAVGAGETLGSEELSNPSFDINTNDWVSEDCTLASFAGGQSNNCLQLTATGGAFQRTYVFALSSATGKLFKFSAYVKSGTSGNEAFTIRMYSDGPVSVAVDSGTSSGSWVQYAGYLGAKQSNFYPAHFYKETNTIGTMLFDEASVKRVTDPPSTAIHIVSSLNGTTRAWESIESGFDPNTITSWGIYNALALLSPSLSPSVSPSPSPSMRITGSFIIFRRRRR